MGEQYYVYYCPRCGRVYTWERLIPCECIEALPFFEKRKLHKKVKLQKIIFETFEEYCAVASSVRFDSDSSGRPLVLYEYIWENYVDIPENTLLDRATFEVFKQSRYEYFSKPKFLRNTATYKCPKCGSTSVSVQSRGFSGGNAAAGAIAGAAVAGPIGLAGAAAGAIGSGKSVRKCNSCGCKW